jgi:virginiamycin B lyase
MRVRHLIIAATTVAVALLVAQGGQLRAQGAMALSGVVSSQEEGTMEGVLVNARREGANFTVTVVSNAEGRYSFPRTHIEPGTYTLTTRASGYDLTDPGPVAVATSSTANQNLRLHTADDPLTGVSSLEIVNSMGGTKDQKDRLVYTALSCAYCHTFKRTVLSKHTPERWPGVIRRMQGYYPDGTASSDDNRAGSQLEHAFGDSFGLHRDTARPERRVSNPSVAPWGRFQGNELGEYLSTVNMSGGRTKLPFELQYLPRPTGKATRVIITQWDQPRKTTMTHDGVVDAKGHFWYADESNQMIGRLDPKTNTFKEYAMPPVREDSLEGTRDILVDNDGNVWTTVRVDGGASVLSKFEPDTEKLTMVKGANGQFVALGGDGNVWTGMATFFRANAETLTHDRTWAWTKEPDLPNGGRVACYQLTSDSKGNPWCTGYFGDVIIGVDKDTGKARFWPTPTQSSMPRRNSMDAQDRIWFAEYTGDKVGMFDTKTEQFKEWPLPNEYTTPYASSPPDKNGSVYVSSNMTERLAQVDTATGDVVEYLMPTDFDSKKITLDPTTDRTVVWMANTRNARILRVEPLD